MLSLASSGNGNGHAPQAQAAVIAASADGIAVATAFDRDRLERALRLLREARFAGLLTHLFALRAFFPDAVAARDETALREVRETLRETLDRLYIKLRVQTYVMAPRDLESAAARDALAALLDDFDQNVSLRELTGSVVLHGACDPRELHALHERLASAPLGTAVSWAILARLLPDEGDALRNYRTMLIAALDELLDVDETEFIDALQRKPYPVLDAALDVVRTQLAHLPA
jgi:hypothetical protein